jgi:hypothetical protein
MSSAARPCQVLSVVSQGTASSIWPSGYVKDQDDSHRYCAPASSIRRSKRCARVVGHRHLPLGCTAATVGGRRSLPVPTSASCSAECHRQRGQQFGGDGPKKSVHLAPALSPGPFTVPTRICCASRGPCRDKLDQVPAGSRTNSTTARSRVDELHPYAGADPAGSASVETSNSATPCGAGWGEPADTPNTLLFPLRVAAAPPAPGPAAGAGATQHSPRITFSRGDVNVLANVNGEPAAMPEGVNWRFIWFWLKFREAGRVVLVRPSGCVFSARRGRGVGRAGPGHRHRLSGLPHEPGVDPRCDRPTVSFTKLEPEPGKWHSVCTLFGPSRARGGPAKPRRRRCRGTGPDSAPVADGVRGRRRCRVGPASPGPIVEVIECRRKCAL